MHVPLQYFIQKVITDLQILFQNKKRTCFNKCFLTRFYHIFILQGYGRTLLHQRGLEAAVRRYFTKKVLLKILQNSQENTCARVTF